MPNHRRFDELGRVQRVRQEPTRAKPGRLALGLLEGGLLLFQKEPWPRSCRPPPDSSQRKRDHGRGRRGGRRLRIPPSRLAPSPSRKRTWLFPPEEQSRRSRRGRRTPTLRITRAKIRFEFILCNYTASHSRLQRLKIRNPKNPKKAATFTSSCRIHGRVK